VERERERERERGRDGWRERVCAFILKTLLLFKDKNKNNKKQQEIHSSPFSKNNFLRDNK